MEPRDQRNHIGRNRGLVSGLPVPLIDRFDEEIDDARVAEPYRIQDLSLLLESIQRELARLLNTRLAPRWPPDSSWEPRSLPQTVVDYGLPVFSPLGSENPADAMLLTDAIVSKIAIFEPRLKDPVLELRTSPDDPAAMIGVLRGSVQLNEVSQPVDFPLCFGGRWEEATVLPGELV